MYILACDISCGDCYDISTNCITCNNKKGYYSYQTANNCIKFESNKGQYIDEETKTIKDCLSNCKKCNEYGNYLVDSKCIECQTSMGYNSVEDKPSHCMNEPPSIDYILDIVDLIWKKCYKSCLSCSDIRNPLLTGYHNCDYCREGYQPYYTAMHNDPPINCIPKRIRGYKFYMTESYEYIPIGENKECPIEHEYLIDSTGECSKGCKVDE